MKFLSSVMSTTYSRFLILFIFLSFQMAQQSINVALLNNNQDNQFDGDDITNLILDGLSAYDSQLPSENRGVVPSKKWKKEKLKKSWYAGETLITGIGQGYLLATPLQMAVMTALIANNGKKLNVTLLKKQDNSNLNKIDTYMNINKEHLKIIKDSMYSVVNEPGGTAYKIKNSNDQYLLSGKTGTSQVKKITVEERESEDFRKKEIKRKDKDHSLFVAYMPSENPRIAISVVAEHEGSGSSTAAPMAKEILDKAHMLGI